LSSILQRTQVVTTLVHKYHFFIEQDKRTQEKKLIGVGGIEEMVGNNSLEGSIRGQNCSSQSVVSRKE
jgi:hypothetical protein